MRRKVTHRVLREVKVRAAVLHRRSKRFGARNDVLMMSEAKDGTVFAIKCIGNMQITGISTVGFDQELADALALGYVPIDQPV